MVLKVKKDVRIFLLHTNWIVVTYILVYSIIYLFHERLKLTPLAPCLIGVLANSVASFFPPQKKIHLQNSYLYLNNSKKEPSPTKDIPIKPEHISGYMLNNPFPKLTKWCESSKNVTLFLDNGKSVILSAKDQDLFLMRWLKENYIRAEIRSSYRGIIETLFLTLISLILFLFYLYLYKTGKLIASDFIYFVTASVCLAYDFLYIVSGLMLKSREAYSDRF